MNLIVIIGVAIGLTILTNIAATPIHSSFDKASQYINIIKEKIIVPSKTEIIYTPSITPEPIKTQIEKYPEIRNFLNNLPDCKWCIACGSYARYTRLEAEKQGIDIKEYKINAPVNKNMIAGHQINYFYADDGHRVYIDNTHNYKDIIEFSELKQYILNRYDMVLP